ncbi:putative Uncharacterized 50.6 kDa protein in the 5'region of gyrA and gyrB (plasmid) [Streptantibioticus cattleyicolor NRRL 8057 = DSM 46488]|nr:putative Uncharacterized 50.6 kDa protein in the 5'region of gyrA and gyrB [Streptantibioticus cattleyicolor NRRL 8057 = DSM 46488]
MATKLLDFIYATMLKRVNDPAGRYWLPTVLKDVRTPDGQALDPLAVDTWDIGALAGDEGATIGDTISDSWWIFVGNAFDNAKDQGVPDLPDDLDAFTSQRDADHPYPALTLTAVTVEGLANASVGDLRDLTPTEDGYRGTIRVTTAVYDTHGLRPRITIDGTYSLVQYVVVIDDPGGRRVGRRRPEAADEGRGQRVGRGGLATPTHRRARPLHRHRHRSRLRRGAPRRDRGHRGGAHRAADRRVGHRRLPAGVPPRREVTDHRGRHHRPVHPRRLEEGGDRCLQQRSGRPGDHRQARRRPHRRLAARPALRRRHRPAGQGARRGARRRPARRAPHRRPGIPREVRAVGGLPLRPAAGLRQRHRLRLLPAHRRPGRHRPGARTVPGRADRPRLVPHRRRPGAAHLLRRHGQRHLQRADPGRGRPPHRRRHRGDAAARPAPRGREGAPSPAHRHRHGRHRLPRHGGRRAGRRRHDHRCHHRDRRGPLGHRRSLLHRPRCRRTHHRPRLAHPHHRPAGPEGHHPPRRIQPVGEGHQPGAQQGRGQTPHRRGDPADGRRAPRRHRQGTHHQRPHGRPRQARGLTA